MKMLRITLEGKIYDVGVEVLGDDAHGGSFIPSALPLPTFSSMPTAAPSDAGSGQIVASPMAGLVFKCLVKPGDVVYLNQELIVLDAMKMETPIYAPVAGTVRTVLVKVGDAVDEGHRLLQIDGDL